MHSGPANRRSRLPMNLKRPCPAYKVWAGAQADIERVAAIWRECLSMYGGGFLFGGATMADAMYAPVCTRFLTYGVSLDADCAAYCARIIGWSPMREWIEAAQNEHEQVDELDMEF